MNESLILFENIDKIDDYSDLIKINDEEVEIKYCENPIFMSQYLNSALNENDERKIETNNYSLIIELIVVLLCLINNFSFKLFFLSRSF